MSSEQAVAHGLAQALEGGLDLVVIAPAERQTDDHVRPEMDGERLEKILEEVGIERPAEAPPEVRLELEIGTPAEVDGHDGQRLVHRIDEKPGAVDPRPVAEGEAEDPAEDQAAVLDEVVLVDPGVAAGGEAQVEQAVPGEGLEHVIEERNGRGDRAPGRSPRA